MSTIIAIIIGIYGIEILIRLLAFISIMSKITWIIGGFISIAICIIWHKFSDRLEKRNPFILVLGIELLFIGASLFGFGISYIFLKEKGASSYYLDGGFWPIGIFIEIALKYMNSMMRYIGLHLNPIVNAIFLPFIGLGMLLTSYPLCFQIRIGYWGRIIIASIMYAIANSLDYGITVYGIMNEVSQEGNPIIQRYIDHFGLQIGVLFHKIIVCGVVIICTMVLGLLYEKDESKKLIPECILYWASILTFFAVGMWLNLGS